MIFYFVSGIICAQYISIDIGSEYIKFAESTHSGEPRLLKDDVFPGIIPAAAAFKSKKPLEYPLTEENINNSELRIGKSALSILKHNQTLGLNYISHNLGRLDNRFTQNGTLITDFDELFGAFLYTKLLGYDVSLGIVPIVPGFWSYEQRNSIARSLDLFDLPLIGILQTEYVYGVLYSSTRSARYFETPKHVLFVDVGATTVQCYSHFYRWNSTHYFSDVYSTSATWTEKVGGLIFERAFAERQNVSLKKARKMLPHINVSTAYQILQPELEILAKTIEDAINTASTTAGQLDLTSTLDEIQIVGGASQIPFISDLIKIVAKAAHEVDKEQINETVEPIEVKKDFNANEALAIGGIYAVLNNEGQSTQPPVHYYPLPSHSIYIKCGKREKYCQRGHVCREEVMLSDTTGCDELILETDVSQVPIGATPILNRYRLLNLSNLNLDADDHPSGFVKMTPPIPAINEVSWCTDKNNCSNIAFQESKTFPPSKFAENFKKVADQKYRKVKLIEKIADMIYKVSPMIGAIDDPGRAVIANDEKHQQMKETIMKYREMLDEGSFQTMNENSLQVIFDDIKIIYKSISKQNKE